MTAGKNWDVDLNRLPGFATPGPLRERLSGLVLAGAKTATFDLYDSARFDPGGVPVPGSRWTMHDSTDRPLAVLRTESVETLRLAEVTFALADLEGESFTSAESTLTSAVSPVLRSCTFTSAARSPATA